MAGYWSPITSNYDWCENNYQVTYYIAEFFNTLSGIPLLMAGLYGLINCYRYNYQYKFYWNYITLMIVGIGTIAFHATLSREGQILDEVPMLWASLSCLYVSFTLNQSFNHSNILLIVMCLYGIIATIIYFYVSFLIFIVSYVLCVAGIIVSTIIQIKRISNGNMIIMKYGVYSALFYAGGFFVLWLPEQILCGNRLFLTHETILTTLQFHAIFHITSTIGSYYWCIYAVFVNYYILKRQPQIMYHTTLSIPVVHIDIASNKNS
eukprot:538604_1